MTVREEDNMDNIEQIILGLAEAFEQETKENNKNLISKMYEQYAENEELYESNVTITFLNMSMLAVLPWISDHPTVDAKGKSVIEQIYNGNFPHFVRRVIEEEEGGCCSGDKEGFVIKKVKKAVAENKNLSLYETYEGYEQISREKWNEQAYWSPKSFKDTDEVIRRFWEWYNVC